nr:hypothetical protein [Tanacetum cinerariifolium]
MAEPLSLDHVFDFPEDDSALNEEEPEEDYEEEIEEGPEEVTGFSPLTPLPPLSESLSDFEFTAPATASRVVWMPPSGIRSRVDKLRRRMDAFDVDLGFIKRDATRTSDYVLALQEGSNSDQEKTRKTMPPRRLKRRAVERLLKSQVAEAIAEYEQNRVNPNEAGGSGDTKEPKVLRCSYKEFLN